MFSSILVGTDGSAPARGAVNRAAELAKLSGAKLLVVCAYRTSNPSVMSAIAPATVPAQDGDIRGAVDSMLAELARELRADGIEVETFACPGNPAQAILDIADGQEADLIVVGNKGMQGARRYLGSVPNSVAHQASCGVLIVRTS